MKEFKYHFSIKIKVLLILALVLCVGGLAFDVYSIISNGFQNTYDAMKYILIAATTIGGFVVILSMLISSKYVVTEKELLSSFGLIKAKYSLSDIDKLTYKSAQNKLSVTFKNGEFMYFSISEEWLQPFADEIKNRNPKIVFEVENA